MSLEVAASPIAIWDPISGSRTALPHRAKTRVNDVTQVLAPDRVPLGGNPRHHRTSRASRRRLPHTYNYK
jgi:hypothetical protein